MTATISDVHTQQPKQSRVQTSKRVILDGLFGYFKSSKNVFEKTFIITLFFIALLCFAFLMYHVGQKAMKRQRKSFSLMEQFKVFYEFCMRIRIQQTYCNIFLPFFLASFPYELHSSIFSMRIKHLVQQA